MKEKRGVHVRLNREPGILPQSTLNLKKYKAVRRTDEKRRKTRNREAKTKQVKVVRVLGLFGRGAVRERQQRWRCGGAHILSDPPLYRFGSRWGLQQPARHADRARQGDCNVKHTTPVSTHVAHKHRPPNRKDLKRALR